MCRFSLYSGKAAGCKEQRDFGLRILRHDVLLIAEKTFGVELKDIPVQTLAHNDVI